MSWNHGGFWVAGAVLLPLLLAVSPYVDIGGDSHRYFLLGQALWSGEGPRAIWLAEPAYETIQPWAWPFLLGGLTAPFRLFGLPAQIAAAQIVNALLWSGVAIASFRFARCFLTAPFATVASAVAVASPLGFFVAASFWSEPLFLVLTFLALEAATRLETPTDTSTQPGRDATRSAVLAAASFWVRLPGLATVGAVLPGLWQHRRRSLPIVALVIASWFAISWMGSNGIIPALGEPGYSEVILSTNAYETGAEAVSLSGLITRGFQNLYHHALWTLPTAFFPSMDFPGFTVARLALLALLAFGAMVIGLRSPWRSLVPMGIYLFLNVGALAAVSNQNSRLLVAFFPIIGLALAGALEFACRDRSHSVVRGAAALSMLCVVALQVPGIAQQIRASRATLEAESGWPYRPDFIPFFAFAEWFRDNSPEDAAVLVVRQTAFYLISGRSGLDWSRAEPPEEICDRMERVSNSRPVFAANQPSDVSAFGIATVFQGVRDTCGDRLESIETGIEGAEVFRYVPRTDGPSGT